MFELTSDQLLGLLVLSFCLGMCFTLWLVDLAVDKDGDYEVWLWWKGKK